MIGTPFTSPFQSDAAFTAAAGRFFELLKSFAAQAPAAQPADWGSLGTHLAGQFEQWLKSSPAAGASFAAAAGFPGAQLSWPPATVPLGPAAAQGSEAQNAWELLMKLGQLQGELARHWSEIAQRAAQRFIARQSGARAADMSTQGALALYELWVECAEEAYAATVRGEDFCQLQAQLANTATALLLAQRRQADTLARAWGLPTREEADALQRQIRDLERQLRERASSSATPKPAAPGAAARKTTARKAPSKGRARGARKRTRRGRS